MKAITPLVALSLATSVYGHGYMVTPPSRTSQGSDAGIDTCPECAILEPVNSWPDLNEAEVGKSGPCGFNERDGLDYNQPGPAWGNETVATFKPGETIEVQWCVDNNGDHGGMFTYRMCQKQEIVDKFLDPDYLPTDAEKQEAEDCFQEGILPCTDVDGQTCDYAPDCNEGEPCWDKQWFTCNAYDDTGCIGVDNAEINSCFTSIAGGYTVTKKVKLPEYTSKHTLLSFKWNSFQTPQVYLGCADISIQ
ncbi:hypothetical protein FQN54_004495 [Arachnomyces sp. PD_36]|nr:hypothetical protein FQN54_004495 [Arachnomyces sp. PD_36]